MCRLLLTDPDVAYMGPIPTTMNTRDRIIKVIVEVTYININLCSLLGFSSKCLKSSHRYRQYADPRTETIREKTKRSDMSKCSQVQIFVSRGLSCLFMSRKHVRLLISIQLQDALLNLASCRITTVTKKTSVISYRYNIQTLCDHIRHRRGH